MLVVLVTKDGQEITRMELRPGKSYVFGRSAGCDLVLDNERGISREHVKLSESGGQWKIELLSKYGDLIIDGKSESASELFDGSRFSIPPYEFSASIDALDENSLNQAMGVSDAPGDSAQEDLAQQDVSEQSVVQDSVVQDFNDMNVADEEVTAADLGSVPDSTQDISLDAESNFPQSSDDEEGDTAGGFADQAFNDEETRVAPSHLIPFIKIQTKKDDPEEILKLEGNLWLAGRDPSCEIFINHPHISRRHFELTKTSEGYFLTDLGSSNGTKVNGEKVEVNQAYKIESGDEIVVRTIKMEFEIRNLQFDRMVEQANKAPVPMAKPQQGAGGAMVPGGAQPGMGNLPANAMRIPNDPSLWAEAEPPQQSFVARNKIRIAIGALVVLMIYMGTSNNPNPEVSNPKDGSIDEASVISEEQKAELRDLILVAQDHFNQQKYQLCLTQVNKIHQIVPVYENSKELENLCSQGESVLQAKLEEERKREEAEKIAAQVSSLLATCEAQVNNNTTLEQIDTCLDQVEVLDPTNVNIARIRGIVEQRISLENNKRDQAAKYIARKNSGLSAFRVCKSEFDKKDYKDALRKCGKYLKSSYPDQGDRPKQAKRMVASIRKEMSTKTKSFLSTCKQKLSQKAYKQAIESCNSALAINSGLSEARELKDTAKRTLTKEMKSIYQDARLEESLGNIESAKLKYRQVTSTDIKGGEFYEKAKSALKKYGGI